MVYYTSNQKFFLLFPSPMNQGCYWNGNINSPQFPKKSVRKPKKIFDDLNTNMAWNISNFCTKLGATKTHLKTLNENKRDG